MLLALGMHVVHVVESTASDTLSSISRVQLTSTRGNTLGPNTGLDTASRSMLMLHMSVGVQPSSAMEHR